MTKIKPQIKPQEFPNLVVRPSGIWNSRAPFHDFLNQHRLENRAYYIGVLTVEKLRYEIRKLPATNPVTRGFFAAKNGSPISGRAWEAYRLSFPRHPDEPPVRPTLEQVLQDLWLSYSALNEYAVVSYSSLFEVFVQCWALNYLLCKLENNESWSQAERHLAMNFCPVFNNSYTPTVLDIGKTIPLITEGLSNLPHVRSDPKTDARIESPISPNLNAWRLVLFWRDWRNLLIHRSGLISRQFCDRYHDFYDEYIASFSFSSSSKSYIPSLKVGEKLTLNDAIFKGVVTVHYMAASWMNQHLQKMSSERRGHPNAPDRKPEGSYLHNPPLRSPSLLLTGDHESSLRWLNDAEYRAELITKFIGIHNVTSSSPS